MSARCNCYKGHNSNSGRCNHRETEGDYCEDCLKYCMTHESLESIVKESTAKLDQRAIDYSALEAAAAELAKAAEEARRALNHAGIVGDPAQFMLDAALAHWKEITK